MKDKPSGKLAQLTDFFKPLVIKTCNEPKVTSSVDVSTTDRDTSKVWNKTDNNNVAAPTTKRLYKERKKCGLRKKTHLYGKMQRSEKSDLCKEVGDDDDDDDDENGETQMNVKVEEISYLDFLSQNSLPSNVDGIQQDIEKVVNNREAQSEETSEEIKKSETSNKPCKLSCNKDEEMFTDIRDKITSRDADGVLAETICGNNDHKKTAGLQPKICFGKQQRTDHSSVEEKEQTVWQDVNTTTEPVSGPDTENAGDAEDEALPLKAPNGCAAITSFFVPSAKKVPSPVRRKTRDSDEVIVMAEVHSPSPISKSTSSDILKKPSLMLKNSKCKRTKKHKVKRCNAVADEEDLDLTITHIETTFITLEKPVTRKQDKCDQNGNNENMKGQLDSKMETINDDEIQRRTSSSTEKKKLSVKRGKLSLDEKEVECSVKPSDKLQDKDDESLLTKKTRFIETKSGIAESAKTKQSVLSFGSKGGTPSPKNRSQFGQMSDVTVRSDQKSSNCHTKSVEGKLIKNSTKKTRRVKNKAPVEVTPPQTTCRRRLRIQENDAESEMRSAEEGASHTYRATLIDPQKHKSGTPLKMKFTR